MARTKPVADWEQALAMVPKQRVVPMGAVDTAWLRMDSAVNRMVIVGVWVLKPSISRAALCARGTSSIMNAHQVDRGYERIDERLRSLGARITREPGA